MRQAKRLLLTMTHQREDDEEDDERGEDGEGDLDPTERMPAGDRPSVAVDDHLIDFGAVGVADEPDRGEDVLEGLLRVGGGDVEIAVSVAGDLLRAELRRLLVHDGLRMLRGG